MRSFILGAAMLCAMSGFVTDAYATELFDDTISTCTTINCSSLRVPGSITSHFGVSIHPWVGQLFKETAPCMRLDVFTETRDLEIVAVAPDGTTYRNDDRGGALDRRPLVVIPPNAVKGWYSVQVSNYNGAVGDANFVLLYGTYPSGNPNCAGATIPFAVAQPKQ